MYNSVIQYWLFLLMAGSQPNGRLGIRYAAGLAWKQSVLQGLDWQREGREFVTTVIDAVLM